MKVLRAGDRAVLIEVADNHEARGLARALAGRERAVDVVAGHRTVLVTWDEAPPDLDADTAAEDEAERPPVDIRVVYDGDDLHDVARLARLSPEEVVRRHLAREYVVAFLGFAPGFAYLLGGDERLHVPRLDTPRPRVPAGSVAVAGPYSGVYPRETPGGWRLLGRTDAVLFDAARTPPALLAPGDRVRFVAS
jgi:KipI family sensor histidine kinase inhibitor